MGGIDVLHVLQGTQHGLFIFERHAFELRFIGRDVGADAPCREDGQAQAHAQRLGAEVVAFDVVGVGAPRRGPQADVELGEQLGAGRAHFGRLGAHLALHPAHVGTAGQHIARQHGRQAGRTRGPGWLRRQFGQALRGLAHEHGDAPQVAGQQGLQGLDLGLGIAQVHLGTGHIGGLCLPGLEAPSGVLHAALGHVDGPLDDAHALFHAARLEVAGGDVGGHHELGAVLLLVCAQNELMHHFGIGMAGAEDVHLPGGGQAVGVGVAQRHAGVLREIGGQVTRQGNGDVARPAGNGRAAELRGYRPAFARAPCPGGQLDRGVIGRFGHAVKGACLLDARQRDAHIDVLAQAFFDVAAQHRVVELLPPLCDVGAALRGGRVHRVELPGHLHSQRWHVDFHGGAGRGQQGHGRRREQTHGGGKGGGSVHQTAMSTHVSLQKARRGVQP